MFLTILLANAQLTVRNNNFIFASDRLLFVEDNINLNDTNSRIYLRDESQIIQGSGINGNSGIGELSTMKTNPAIHMVYRCCFISHCHLLH